MYRGKNESDCVGIFKKVKILKSKKNILDMQIFWCILDKYSERFCLVKWKIYIMPNVEKTEKKLKNEDVCAY